jgi:hypothetical protein
MGSAAPAPRVVGISGKGNQRLRTNLTFLDPQTFQELDYEIVEKGRGVWFMHPSYPPQMRASADGSVLTAWTPNLSPTGFRSWVGHGNTWHGYYEHTSAGYLLPGPDGQTIYTPGQLFTAEGKARGPRVGGHGNMVWFLPALQGPFYLSLNELPRGSGGRQTLALRVHVAGDGRPLITLPSLPALEGLVEWTTGRTQSLEQHVFLMPLSKLLVLVPASKDKLILQRFDWDALLAQADVDYLFVQSQPMTTAHRGQPYVYPLEVKSKKGGVKIKLDAGPAGMAVTADRQLRWTVPEGFAEERVTIILTISDASGQEVLHSFTLGVGK